MVNLASSRIAAPSRAFLEADAGVRLNTPAWSGLTSHARVCFAIPEARVEAVLERLKNHLKKITHEVPVAVSRSSDDHEE